MKKRVAIIAALPGELAELVRGWQKQSRNTWTGTVNNCECLAIAGGIGAAAAARAFEQAIASGPLDAVLSIGWAGSLTCGLKPKHAVAIYEVLDASTGERFVTDYSAGQKLITLDHVARAGEKRRLAETYQATVVDMEAAAIARLAAARNLAFYCFKGISDGSNDVLPDFSKFIDNGGKLRMAQLLFHVSLRPKYWKAMQQLGKNSKSAAASLATITEECLKKL